MRRLLAALAFLTAPVGAQSAAVVSPDTLRFEHWGQEFSTRWRFLHAQGGEGGRWAVFMADSTSARVGPGYKRVWVAKLLSRVEPLDAGKDAKSSVGYTHELTHFSFNCGLNTMSILTMIRYSGRTVVSTTPFDASNVVAIVPGTFGETLSQAICEATWLR